MSRQQQRAAARDHARVAPPPPPPPAVRQPSAPVAQSRPRSDTVLENLALALLSGILLATPFLVAALWWIHYVALVPWILLVTREHTRRAWLYFFAGAYTFYIMALGPLSLFHKAVPFVLAALYAPFLLPFALLLRLLYRRLHWPLAVLVPVLWVTAEWVRLRYSIGAVALFPLGSSQFNRTTLIQIAEITGVYGISFVVAGANGAIVDVWQAIRGRRWQRAVAASCYLVLLIGVLGYGAVRLERLGVVAGPRVAVVQPNAVHYRDARRAMQTFQQQADFTRSSVAPGNADLIAWPENAIGEPFSDDPRYLAGLGDLARRQGAHLLVGSFTWADSLDRRVHTSALYFSPQGSVLGRYDKVHMIPWAEYIPFHGWLNRVNTALATTFLGYTSRGVAGTEVVVFAIRTADGAFEFAVPICFEVSNGAFAREAAVKHAAFLVNITSEGLLGPPMYVHMLAHSTFRAIENRMAVVRVANNGLSGFIDPAGRPQLMRGVAGRWLFREAGILIDRVPVNAAGSGTFYTRHGDLLVYGCAGLSLVLFAWTFASLRSRAASAPATDTAP